MRRPLDLRPQGLGHKGSYAQEQQRGKGLRGRSVASVVGTGFAELGLDEGGRGRTLTGIWGRVDVLPEARSGHDDLVVDCNQRFELKTELFI